MRLELHPGKPGRLGSIYPDKSARKSEVLRRTSENIRQALAGHHIRICRIALTTGMRPSEYLGLTWNDLRPSNRGTASVSPHAEWRRWLAVSFSSVAIEIGLAAIIRRVPVSTPSHQQF